MLFSEAVEEFDSLRKLRNPPNGWGEAMAALVYGEVDYGELRPMLMACCEQADTAADENDRLTWDLFIVGLIEIAESCMWGDRQGSIEGMFRVLRLTGLAETYLRMGRAADRWQASQQQETATA